ncbi:MAG TPA: IPT/TIG domain-containing protein [Vicinamibacterales bacterium]
MLLPFLTAASTKYWCGRSLGLSMLLVLLFAGPAESAVTLAWDPNPEGDIAGYIISYGTNSRQYTTSIDVGDTTTFVFAQPDPTKVYFLAVQAYNDAGLRSPFSNEVSTSAVARPLTATGLTSNAPAQARTGNVITFTATATGGRAPYHYKWWVSDGAASTVGQNWSTNNTFAWRPTQAKPGYRITVWVRNASSTIDNFDNPGARLSMTVAVVGATPITPIVSVNSVAPGSGSTGGGTTVTIKGANFASGAIVRFGTTAATAVTVVNSTSITARTPAHVAGVVAVVVTNPNKQSGTRANAFAYAAPAAPPPSLSPPPTVSGVTPNTGSTRGGTTVTISGANFVPGATVTFGGVPAATTVVVANSKSIVATTPAHVGGPVAVIVINPNKQTGTRASGFTYIAVAPPPAAPPAASNQAKPNPPRTAG